MYKIVLVEMSLSTIHFKMRHSKDEEQVFFPGNGISLLDFKSLVIEKKKITQALDFDLKVVDLNSKGTLSIIFLYLID